MRANLVLGCQITPLSPTREKDTGRMEDEKAGTARFRDLISG